MHGRGKAAMPPPQYPSMPPRQSSGDEAVNTKAFLDRLEQMLIKSKEDMAQYVIDRTNRVDEFRPQSLTGETLTIESWLPDYEGDEIIESVIVTGPPAGAFTALSQQGVSVDPPAGTTIASVTVPPGQYNITWNSILGSGTSVDVNNTELFVGNTLIGVVPMYGFPQSFTTVVVVPEGAGPTVISVKTIVLASGASATYQGTLSAASVSGFTLQLGKRAWQLELPSSGILVIAPIAIKMSRDSTRQLIAGSAGDWSVELMGYVDTGRRGRV